MLPIPSSAENLETFKKLLIIGMACLVTALFVVWKTFHKNLLGVYYIRAFLFIAIFIYLYILLIMKTQIVIVSYHITD